MSRFLDWMADEHPYATAFLGGLVSLPALSLIFWVGLKATQ